MSLKVLKTYKLYIGGKFPRTESGRSFPLNDKNGKRIANMCLASRKDFRNAVVAARKAQPGWAAASAYLRGQILYRIAEMVEDRLPVFVEELKRTGSSPKGAEAEAKAAIDSLVHYAGWTDKYLQVFSAVNPVASSHFNFSMPEPTGIVAAFAPQKPGLAGLVDTLAPVITGGNTVVVMASKLQPTVAITLAEALNDSDVPAGVVNILTGDRSEILSWAGEHMDVNALLASDLDAEEKKTVQELANVNVKRLAFHAPTGQDPYRILDFQEVKTTWHPIGTGDGGAGSTY